jgi:hypothetical protein
MVTVPLWFVYFIISIIAVLGFALLFTRRSELEIKNYASFLHDIVKSYLIQNKKDEEFIPRCYFDQADTKVMSFKFVKDGLNIYLQRVKDD